MYSRRVQIFCYYLSTVTYIERDSFIHFQFDLDSAIM